MSNPDVVRFTVMGVTFAISNAVPYFCSSDIRNPGDGDDKHEFANDKEKHKFEGAADAIESLVLAHCRAGVDVQSKEYKEGLETTLEALLNNYL